MSHTLHPLRRQRLQRSELAVPASNPTMIDKAAESAADFVFLDLERGKFAEGHVGYVDRRGENGGLLRIESMEKRMAVANIEQVESKELEVGDVVVFSPDLVLLPGYAVDLAQVEWVSE